MVADITLTHPHLQFEVSLYMCEKCTQLVYCQDRDRSEHTNITSRKKNKTPTSEKERMRASNHSHTLFVLKAS